MLSIPASAKSTEISRLTKQHDKTLRELRESIDVKQALIKQVEIQIRTQLQKMCTKYYNTFSGDMAK